jgi:flagellar biosynthesis protein FlhF
VLEVFVGNHLPTVLSEVRRSLGDDACVVEVTTREGRIEVLASPVALTVHPVRRPPPPTAPADASREDPDPEHFGAVLRTPAAAPAGHPRPRAAQRPRADAAWQRPAPVRPTVIALVGPTGAGKTTTLAKLATNPIAFGGRSVGVLGLDTYRIGAVEQLETYAELAGMPCEVAYDLNDLDRALGRLIECDVVLVDTPGRGPRQSEDLATIRRWLARLVPDEIHLVLPASMMPQVMRRTIASFSTFHVTHMLATKLDECPLDTRVFDVVARQGRPMRWYADGQEVPADLHDAVDRLERAVSRQAAQLSAQEAFA